ncbi:MAG: hypothetical protein K6E50_13855 [Lachnospiraceae bacterium]|nr:hypothetical protein [Lachnospiraceae bacterium]
MKNGLLRQIGKMLGGIVLSGVLLLHPVPGLPGADVIRAEAAFDATLLVTKDPNAVITDADREVCYAFLVDHMNTLKTLYDLSPEGCKRMNEVFYVANVFIAENDLTVEQLTAYMTEVEANLTTAAQTNVKGANEFLFLTNTTGVPSAVYEQGATVKLSVVNLGETLLQDVLITPAQDTDPAKWPFVITSAEATRKVYRLEPVQNPDEADKWSQTVSWNFQVSKLALSGTYPLTFHAQYYRDGEIEKTDLVTYINITGAPGNGYLNEGTSPGGKTSTPRIIVTGFTTDPADVYAGDTFHLTITVQNASAATAVSNIQFDLRPVKDGTGDSAVEAFQPTSGSNTIFVDRIPAGGTKDLQIEMTARSDLNQKPYAIELEAAYEDERNNPFTASTSVSIPVHQEARVDTGDVEVVPESMSVGGSSNVMFSVYNKGKTTLYNVGVEFQGDSISGGSSFIGKIDPGASGNVDAMLTGMAPTMDDGTVTAVISYEDEAGNVTTLEKPFTLMVFEEDFSGMEYGEFGEFGETEEDIKKPFPWGILVGGVVLIIIVGVVLAVILSKRKKKKALQAELDAMDETENDEDNEDGEE